MSMLVSNFSAGYDLINRHKSSRTMYMLQITNLEPIPITLGLETRLTNVFFFSSGKPQSDLVHLGRMFWTAVYKLDDGYYNYSTLDIEANGMQSVNICPLPIDSDLQGFVFGYVSLRVPMVRSSTPP